MFFFSLDPFSARSGLLSKGLFYWSVSRLVEGWLEKAKSKPNLLRRGLAGGWRWGRGGVPRRATLEWLEQSWASRLAANACMAA